jgi:hypothetical protein
MVGFGVGVGLVAAKSAGANAKKATPSRGAPIFNEKEDLLGFIKSIIL